jgi:hypothetical protein
MVKLSSMEIKKVCSTEVGLLAVYDPQSFSEIDLGQKYGELFVNDADMLRLMNKGKAVVWGTGGDGSFGVRVRINPDQDLTNDEKEIVEMEAHNLRLTVTSGKIQADTPDNIVQVDKDSLGEVPFGNYLVTIYFLFDPEVMDMDEAEYEEQIKLDPDFDRTGYMVILKTVDEGYSFPAITEVPQLG